MLCLHLDGAPAATWKLLFPIHSVVEGCAARHSTPPSPWCSDGDPVHTAIPKCVDAGPLGAATPYSTLPLWRSSSPSLIWFASPTSTSIWSAPPSPSASTPDLVGCHITGSHRLSCPRTSSSTPIWSAPPTSSTLTLDPD
jgi:hypothetical protein